jgi:vacuolar-type H+-ATPase subunit C/Vma6
MFTKNSKNRGLLQSPDNRGYPTEYLLARLRGRSVYLVKDWMPVLHATDPMDNLPTRYKALITEHSIEEVWRHLLRESRWVYHQMNEELRNVFYLFFLYTELKTLFSCLRYKTKKGVEENVEKLLALSLLSEKVKTAIVETESPVSVIEEVEDDFNALSERFRGLKEIFIKSGLKEFEQKLTDIYLEYAVSLRTHPVINGFFVYVIDARNIITVYKSLRWKTSPSFAYGGNLDEAGLGEIIDRQDIKTLGTLIYKLTDTITSEPTSLNITALLLNGLMRFSKKRAKEFLDIGFILNYLLRCHREARNLNIILHGRGMDREVIRGELI